MLSRGMSIRGMSTRNLVATTGTTSSQHQANGSSNVDNVATSAPRRQSVQFVSTPKGLGLARQSSRRILTSASTPDLEKFGTGEKKEKSVEHHKG